MTHTLWDHDTALDYQQRLRERVREVDRLRVEEAAAKEAWQQAVEARKQAQAKLEELLRASAEELPLFDRAEEPEESQNGPDVDPEMIAPPEQPGDEDRYNPECNGEVDPLAAEVHVGAVRVPVDQVEDLSRPRCWLPDPLTERDHYTNDAAADAAHVELCFYPPWWGRTEDLTGCWERTMVEHRLRGLPESRADRKRREQIIAWRTEQATEAEPALRWGHWCEFGIDVDGQRVQVLYEPDAGLLSDHFEFHGSAISSTGYYSHHTPYGFEPGSQDITLYAWEVACDLRKAMLTEQAKEARKRKPRMPKVPPIPASSEAAKVIHALHSGEGEVQCCPKCGRAHLVEQAECPPPEGPLFAEVHGRTVAITEVGQGPTVSEEDGTVRVTGRSADILGHSAVICNCPHKGSANRDCGRDGPCMCPCHPAESATIAVRDTSDAWSWPEGLDPAAVRRAYSADRFGPAEPRPSSVLPFTWDGRLWLVTRRDSTGHRCLPLVSPEEFRERWPGIPLRESPGLPAEPTDEDRLQFYTGCRVRVAGEVWVIAPAGEGRLLGLPPEERREEYREAMLASPEKPEKPDFWRCPNGCAEWGGGTKKRQCPECGAALEPKTLDVELPAKAKRTRKRKES